MATIMDVQSNITPSNTTPIQNRAVADCTVFISSFLGVHPGWIADTEDRVYTSWLSVYLVLFASAFLQSRSPELLGRATGFPFRFTDLVVRIMDMDNFWQSDSFTDLFQTLRDKRHDLFEVYNSFEYMQESVKRPTEPQFSEWLHTARNGVLFGGAQETPDQYSGDE